MCTHQNAILFFCRLLTSIIDIDHSVSKTTANNFTTDILADLDCRPLLFYTALFILVDSLNETGLPEQFFAYALDGCIDQLTSDECLYEFAGLFGVLTTIVSPVPAVLMFAKAFPYANSYIWMQVAWIATMAGSI